METKYSSTELKELSSKMTNCPFCHGNKVKITSISKGASKGSYYQGLCNRCYARGPKRSDPYLALEKWNDTYLGDYVPEYKLDENQINKLLNNEIVIRCNSQLKFNALINAISNTCANAEASDDWYLWGKYRDNTVVEVSNSETLKRCFGYCDVEYFNSINSTIEDLIIT